MVPWVRIARITGALALIAGGGAAGVYLQGRLLGVIGLLVGGCLAFAVLFLTSPTCDRCGSLRINRLNGAPEKCSRCGYVHGASTENVVLTDSLVKPQDRVQKPGSNGWLSTLRAFSLGVFLLGVGIVIYSVMGLTVPSPLDPTTWDAKNTWRIFVSIFGLALNTLGLMIYIVSYKLA